MKKVKLIAALILITAAGFAQEMLQPQYAYCQIVGTYSILTNKLNIIIDYGDYVPLGDTRALTDDDGNKLEFNTMIHALNFMSAWGWEYVQAFALNGSASITYHYILKKPFAKLTKEGQDAMMKELNDITISETKKKK